MNHLQSYVKLNSGHYLPYRISYFQNVKWIFCCMKVKRDRSVYVIESCFLTSVYDKGFQEFI